MHPLSLVFVDEEIEWEFRFDFGDKYLSLARFAMLSSIALWFLFGALDALVLGDVRDRVFLIRYAFVGPVLLAAVGSLYSPSATRLMHASQIVGLLAIGLGTIWMTVEIPAPHGPHYYAGLVLALTFGYTLMAVRALHAAVTGWMLVAAYEISAATMADIATSELTSNSFFLVSLSAVGMTAAYLIERSRRRDFIYLKAIEVKRKELESLNRNLEELATRDALTGLLNRRSLMDRMREAQALNRRYATVTTVMVIDLDDFKLVNDTLGHAAGDEVLCAVANVLRNSVRANDQAFRFGGDEFVVMLPRTPPEVARAMAERLVISVAERCAKMLPDDINVGCSVGISAIMDASETAAEVLQRADQALYEVKCTGKGRALLHGTELEPVGS